MNICELICPSCRLPLRSDGKSLRCGRGHCFDIAKSGYVTLTQSPGSGDDKEMVRARSAFLDSGAYKPFADAICNRLDAICNRLSGISGAIVDAGCGEGYYTTLIARHCEGSRVFGFDLSKTACDKGAKRAKAMKVDAFFAAASVFSLPIADNSCEAVTSLFAPIAEAEFARILKPDGLLLIGGAGRRHLLELKQAVYDRVYENEGRRDLPCELFELIESVKVEYRFTCEGDNIRSLFSMTPYAFKTSVADRAKLDSLDRLEIGADFDIFVYKRK